MTELILSLSAVFVLCLCGMCLLIVAGRLLFADSCASDSGALKTGEQECAGFVLIVLGAGLVLVAGNQSLINLGLGA